MSAHQQMRRMLDELMGTGRNGDDGKEKLSFSNKKVCKCFLLNCCPHDLLSATRCELGKCPKVHEFALRADYEAAAKEKDFDYHHEALEQLKKFIAETERRTQIAKQRLAEAQQMMNANETIKDIKMQALDKKIELTLANLEKLGQEENVEESLQMMKNLEEFKEERASLEKVYRSYVPNSKTQQQKLRVCEICSSYLGFEENDDRLVHHFSGRLHMGFVKIREKIEELENYIQDKHIKKFLDKEFQSSSQMQNSPRQSAQFGNEDSFKHPFSSQNNTGSLRGRKSSPLMKVNDVKVKRARCSSTEKADQSI